MTRAAIYARVSSAAQRERHTIDSQLRLLREHVRREGWTLVGEYIDDGHSAKAGKLDARDGFARLVADAEARRFDVLAIADVDRLTRTDDMRERARILGPFQAAGIEIHTPTGGAIDLRTFLGEVYVTLQALVAAEENRKRAERVKAGKLRAIAEGRKPAGPTPFGLAYDRGAGAWSIDPVRGELVREIARRILAGEACSAIADDFHARAEPSPRGPWRAEKVWRIAVSTHTVGRWVADKRRRLTVPVPAILDESTYQAVQDALAAHNRRGLVHTRHVYLLEGLATCGACGSPIWIRSASRGGAAWPAYVCRARKRRWRGDPACRAPIVATADLDARVWSAVAAELAGPDLAEAIAAKLTARAAERRDWDADARGYRAHLDRLARVEAGVLARWRRGTVSDQAVDLELAAIGRERTAVAEQLATAERAGRRAAQAPGGAEAIVAGLRALAASAAPEARQRVVRLLIAPGGVVLAGERARLAIAVDPAPALASVSGTGSRTQREDMPGIVRIRLVA